MFLILVDGTRLIVTRSCGYLANNETGRENRTCYKDAFTSFSSSIYCDCSGNQCNHAEPGANVNLLLTILLSIVMVHTLIRARWVIIRKQFRSCVPRMCGYAHLCRNILFYPKQEAYVYYYVSNCKVLLRQYSQNIKHLSLVTYQMIWFSIIIKMHQCR